MVHFGRHDRLFLALGALTTLALAISGSWVALECAAATLVYAVLIAFLRQRDLERVALLTAYGFSLWFYLAVARIVPGLGHGPFDAGLLSIDEALFGSTPSVYFQGAPGWLTDLLSVAYFLYLPYLHGVGLWELAASRERAVALGARLFPAFALGYTGYLLVPAVGPALFDPSLYAEPLGGGWITTANEAFMTDGSPGYDVFPSLHVLITLVVWFHDWRFSRFRAWAMAPVVVALFISTLHLRYHYAIDLLAGILVFFVVLWIARER